MKRISFLLIIFCFFLVACGTYPEHINESSNNAASGERKLPPELTVTANSKTIDAVKGTISWQYQLDNGKFAGIEGDSGPPPELVKNHKMLDAGLGSTISLNFEENPQKVEVNVWNDNKRIRTVEVNNLQFKTDEKGKIIYEIYATWEQGTAHYAIMVNVQ